MTVLSRSARAGAPDQVAIECDVCIPPVLTVTTDAHLRASGWQLAATPDGIDVCPHCCRTRPARERVRRADDRPGVPDPARLPNVLVVGAAKAATTSLHAYLDAHPEVAMSPEKEMRFFTDPHHRDWLERYQSSFDAGARYRGESTPAYTMTPVFPGVVDRMADLVPDARLLYVVREPVARVLAEYVENVVWGTITVGVDEALADAASPSDQLVAPSRYATQLRELHRRFAPEQVHVVVTEHLAARPQEVMDEVFGWLGLAPVVLDEEALRPRNQRLDKGRLPGWYGALRQPWLVRAVHRLPADRIAALRSVVRRRVLQPVERPEPSPETRERLAAVLAPEVADLREMTGVDLSDWLR